jgi:hypothetical protein
MALGVHYINALLLRVHSHQIKQMQLLLVAQVLQQGSIKLRLGVTFAAFIYIKSHYVAHALNQQRWSTISHHCTKVVKLSTLTIYSRCAIIATPLSAAKKGLV